MRRRRHENRVQVDRLDAERLQVVQVGSDALQVSAVEAAVIVGRRGSMPIPDFAHRRIVVCVFAVDYIVSSIAVRETVREDLVLKGAPSPCGRLASRDDAEIKIRPGLRIYGPAGAVDVALEPVAIGPAGASALIDDSPARPRAFHVDAIGYRLEPALETGLVPREQLVFAATLHGRGCAVCGEKQPRLRVELLFSAEAHAHPLAEIGFDRATERLALVAEKRLEHPVVQVALRDIGLVSLFTSSGIELAHGVHPFRNPGLPPRRSGRPLHPAEARGIANRRAREPACPRALRIFRRKLSHASGRERPIIAESASNQRGFDVRILLCARRVPPPATMEMVSGRN